MAFASLDEQSLCLQIVCFGMAERLHKGFIILYFLRFFDAFSSYPTSIFDITLIHLHNVSLAFGHSTNVGKTYYSHVKIPKRMAFSKCTNCVKYKTIIANTKDPVEKSYARAKLATHHQRVTTECQFTELNLAKSRTDEDFFFCGIDGMDSSKTLEPRSVVKDKNTLSVYLLKTHVTCVKYNGRRPNHVYFLHGGFPTRQCQHFDNHLFGNYEGK